MEVLDLAFSPHGEAGAASLNAGGKNGVLLIDALSRRDYFGHRLPVAEGPVVSLAFSPDGKTLAAGYDGFGPGAGDTSGVVLFDARTGKRLQGQPIFATKGSIRRLVYSPDGKALVVGFKAGWVVRCETDLESWKRQAARIANRNLNRDEWKQFFPDTLYHVTFDELPAPPERSD